MTPGNEVFVSRLNACKVFDVDGALLGKVKDIVVILSNQTSSRAVGFVIEIYGKKQIFVPINRITSISVNQIVITGLLNFRQFAKRELEFLSYGDLFGRIVDLQENNQNSNDVLQNAISNVTSSSASAKGLKSHWKIEDFAIKMQQNSEWQISKVFVRKVKEKNSISLIGKKLLGRQGETKFVGIKEVIEGDKSIYDSEHIIESLEQLNAADAADVLMDLDSSRQAQIAKDLDNEKLADVLEEMPEENQAQILEQLDNEDAADILEEMEPDDAADLLNTMEESRANELLEEMNPEEAEDVRTLMEYSDNTAGGLMTLNPVIMTANSTVASALAQIRQEKLSPTLASIVFVCKQPLETPTGQFLGVIHFQHLLRLPPHQQLANFLETNIGFVNVNASINEVAKVFATYNAIIVPVLDEENRLVGAITVDDVLDHILPENWRAENIINGGRYEV